MRDSDVLDNNPHVSRSALEAMHDQVFAWALSRYHYDQAVAEDVVQTAYVQLLSGKAQFNERSSLKTFVSAVVHTLARSHYRRLATRLRLVREVARDAERGCITTERRKRCARSSDTTKNNGRNEYDR